MSKRGRVLRDPHMGPGLLIVEGKQYPFFMESIWRSEVPAKPGLVVSVDFDAQENIVGITAVPQRQLDAEKAASVQSGSRLRSTLLEGLSSKGGSFSHIAGTGLLLISWTFLAAVSIHLPLLGKLELTFWQILGYLNAGGISQISDVAATPDSGIFGFLAILVLAGPFLPYVWKDRRAWLGGLLPLAFMIFIAFCIDADFHVAFGLQAAGMNVPVPTSISSAITMGLGTYLSAFLAVCFAVLSTRQWVGSRRVQEAEVPRSQQLAA